MKTFKFEFLVFCFVLSLVGLIYTAVQMYNQREEIINLKSTREYIENAHKEELVDSLFDELNERDSIINKQHEYIITLTYQHEDDDALMEEEQP